MDFVQEQAVKSQLDSLGRELGLTTSSPRASKWSVFGRGSAAAQNGGANTNSSANDADELNFPPLIKRWFVDVSVLHTEESLAIMRNAKFVLIGYCVGWGLNLLTAFILMVASTHLGWVWFLLSLLFTSILSPLACWNYAMTFRAFRYSTVNVVRNAMWFYAAMLVLPALTYAIVGAANFNGWTRFLTSYGDLRMFWDVMASLESSVWTTISISQIFLIFSLRNSYNRLANNSTASHTTTDAASSTSLQAIRDRHSQAGTVQSS
mmetsp:Transcript_11157/g.23966  ORF Transcript_11157/g.23966 Transcript_11157/m.23966 type:complete len:264 (+) Transcript_11157:2-793(+)